MYAIRSYYAEEAIDAVEAIMFDKIFGNSGNQIVIEEFLSYNFV